MALTITHYRGYRISLLSSEAGHSALVYKSGVILGFARASRKEGLKVALRKALVMIDEQPQASKSRSVSAGFWQRGMDRLRR